MQTPTYTAIRGKVGYLLLVVVLAQSMYPITASGKPVALLFFQLIYGSLIAVGIWVARENPLQTRILNVLGILWAIAAVVYTFNQTAVWVLFFTYVVIVLFQAMVIHALLMFIFNTKEVDQDVLYAASAVYLLLGAVFVPIYGFIETFTFVQTGGMHAFTDGVIAQGTVFPWQDFIYYSYATLTTLGYGDMLPLTMWARSAASMEAVVGVLYITIIMARLVGLYATRETEPAR